MDCLKETARRIKFNLILAYADNNAIRFFEKQSFSHMTENYKSQIEDIEKFFSAKLMAFKVPQFNDEGFARLA